VENIITANYSSLQQLLQETNASLTNLITTQSGQIYALIQTSQGTILAKIDNSTSVMVKNINDNTKNIMDELKIIENLIKTNVSKNVSSAQAKANGGLAIGGSALVLSIAGILLAIRAVRI
jgi:hypothetical protein